MPTRPMLDAKLDQLAQWLTGERFRVAWELAKMGQRQRGSQYPAFDLRMSICCSSRAVTSWTQGGEPDRVRLDRINRTFRRVIGPDWMERVENALQRARGNGHG